MPLINTRKQFVVPLEITRESAIKVQLRAYVCVNKTTKQVQIVKLSQQQQINVLCKDTSIKGKREIEVV